MKIIGTVVLVLIAGIVNFTNAQSRVERMESYCTEYGGPEAYNVYVTGLTNYRNCSSSMEFEILQHFRSGGNATIDSSLTMYCTKVEDFSDCIKIFMDSAKPCVEPIVHELIDLGVNSTALILQFPCQNRQLVKDLMTSTDRGCLNSKLGALENCGVEFFTDNNQTSSTTVPNLLAAEIDSLESEFDTKMCNGIQKFEQCVITAMAGCRDQIFATALDSLFKYLNNEIPCANLPKSQKSVVSPDSSADNLL